MVPEVTELIETFSKELMSLSGQAYAARTSEEAANIVSIIAVKNHCVIVAKQRLNLEGGERITSDLEAHGIHVIELEESAKPVGLPDSNGDP
jgi:L-lactate utilization protein LutB